MNPPDSRFEPIHEQFQPVSIEKIQELELKLSAKLPEPYINFLMHYGGCGFSGFACAYFRGRRLPIAKFFDFEKLFSNLMYYDDLTADKKLAIANDFEGNIYVLDCSTSSVYYLDFTVNPPVGFLVETTFDRFLQSIQVEPSD